MTAQAEQAERARWLAERKTGVCGTDIAPLCGVDPYGRTAVDVYLDKVGLGPERESTMIMRLGQLLEPVAVLLYSERTGRRVRKQQMRRHPKHDWMLGTLDRQILRSTERPTGALEAKVQGLAPFAKVKAHGLADGYVLQLMWYLAVFGYEWGSFALFSRERGELIWFDLERDQVLIDRLIEIGGRFWRENVLAQVRPVLDVVELPPLPEIGDHQITTRDDPEWAQAIGQLKEAKELKATAEEVEASAKATIQQLMGRYGVVEGAGARVYWRELNGRKTFERKALERYGPLDPLTVAREMANVGVLPSILATVLPECRLDLSQFEVQGKPYPEFRSYFLPDAGERARRSHA